MMNIPTERGFICDLKEGETSLNEFFELVCGSTAMWTPVLKSGNLAEVFSSIVQAFAFERDLILLDEDLSDDESHLLIGDSESVNISRKLESERLPQDIESLIERVSDSTRGTVTLFTSGTTGRPKKVTHTFKTLGRGLKRSEKHHGNIWGYAFNPTHMAGIQVFLQAFMNANRIVNLFGRQRDMLLRSINDYEVTHISATPTFYRLLLPAESSFPNVCRITFGGERFDEHLRASMGIMFPNARILNVYASTEAGSLFASEGDVFEIRPECSSGVRVKDNELLLCRELLGRFDAPDEWFVTGDIVEVVEERPLRIRFVRRDSEMVNVGGYKVNPHEVEDVLRSHEAIRDARVYSKSNSVLGYIILADVVCEADVLTEVELRGYLQARLQPYKVPRMIRFVQNLQMTRTGKVQR